MMFDNKNYIPDIDGRIYFLMLDQKRNVFINFEERELIEITRLLKARNIRLYNKFKGLLLDVADKTGIINPLVDGL